MKVHVKHHYGDALEHFEGEPEQVSAQLRVRFPWLAEGPFTSLGVQDDISAVAGTQAYDVEVEP